MLDSGAKHNRTLLSTMSAHSCRIGGSMWKAYLYGEKIGIEREHDGAMNECQRQRLNRHCRQRQGTRERDQQRAARWYAANCLWCERVPPASRAMLALVKLVYQQLLN